MGKSSDCAASFQDPTLAVGMDANPSGIMLLTHLMQLGNSISEDCLTINVWTKPQVGEKKKAVMVWIYGGGNYQRLCQSFSAFSSHSF
jgi:cholinesterase